MAIELTYRELLDPEFDRPQAPLYYLVLKAWASIAGASDFSLRALSVAFATASIPFVYAIGRQIGGHRTGAVAMVIFVTVPFVYSMAPEARCYAILLFLSATVSWCALRIVQAGDMPLQRWSALWAAMMVSVLLMLGAHHGAWIWAPFVVAACLPSCLSSGQRLGVAAGVGMVAVVVYAAVLLPDFLAGLEGSSRIGQYAETYYSALVGVSIVGNGREMPIAAVSTLAGLWLALQAWLKTNQPVAGLVAAAVIAPVLLFVLISILPFGPSSHPKFLIGVFPMFAVAVAFGLLQLRKRWMLTFLAFLIACNMAGIVLFAVGEKAPPWKESASIISTNSGKQVAVVCKPFLEDAAPYLEKRGVFAEASLPPDAGSLAGYDDVWLVKNIPRANTPDDCRPHPTWGDADETIELRYDRLHLWHVISGREKEHRLILERYSLN